MGARLCETETFIQVNEVTAPTTGCQPRARACAVMACIRPAKRRWTCMADVEATERAKWGRREHPAQRVKRASKAEGALDWEPRSKPFLREVEKRVRIALRFVQHSRSPRGARHRSGCDDPPRTVVRDSAERGVGAALPPDSANRIRDIQRRRAVRSRFWSFSAARLPRRSTNRWPKRPRRAARTCIEQVTADDAMLALERALSDVPARQREAFMLRNFEGLDAGRRRPR